MTIHLDHAIVPAKDRRKSAELIATILGVPWAETGVGPFCPVYVSDSFTLDVDEWGDKPFQLQHFCFRVSEREFDGIFRRLQEMKIPYRSSPVGEVDYKINTDHGGRIVYWSEPDGHAWEALTVSYARQAPSI